MILRFLLFILVFFTASTLSAQSHAWQWARTGAGTDGENINCITSDVNGNILVSGYFYSSSLTIGNFTLNNSGNYDVFIAKYDAAGNVLWAKSAGGVYDDVGMGIVTDATGNVVVTGYFYSTVFSAGNYSLANKGAGDIFVLKFDPSGNELWTKGFGGSNDESATSLATDNAGNLFLTGSFKSSILTVGADTLTNTGADDIFLMKLNAPGLPLWCKGFEGSANDKGNALTTDVSGNIFLTGLFSSPFLVIGADTILNQGSSDVFVTGFNSSGNALWTKSFNGTFNDSGDDIITDASGNILVTGTYNSPVLTVGSNTLGNTGGFDFFLAKFSNNGNLLWTKHDGGIFDDTGYGIVTDVHENIYVTGHFHSPSFIFGADTIHNNGIGDIYLVSYSSSGQLYWVEQIGGTADDGSGCLTIDKSGDLYIGGYFISPVLYCSSDTLTNTGSEDLFLTKLKLEHITTFIKNTEAEPQLNIYPNPSAGEINIGANHLKEASVEIIDQTDRIIYRSDLDNEHRRVDISGNPPGLYLIRITSQTGFFVKKLLIK